MIVKERKVPVKILKLEALLRRLPDHHIKRPLIEEELAISKAGFRGEQSIDFYLEIDPNPRHFFLHDLRLRVRDQFFQIDTLLLAPGYLLIMEMKNIAGTIVFEEQFQQMIRIMEEKEERFLNPVLQTARQRVLLQEWFAQYKQPSLKIHKIPVFTNKKATIKSFKHNLQVIQLGQLPSFLSSLDKKFASKTLTNRDQQTLSSFFVQQHAPLEIDILQRFQLKEEDLIKGISCPQCYKFSMVRHLRKWHCPACLFSTRDAHVRALQDYFLLLYSTITNRQLREFLQVPCPQRAHYLLSSMNLISEGKNKGRSYMLNFNS